MNIVLSFFKLILKPFELLLTVVFTFAFNLTGNYGISLILMSFFITIIIAPLYYFAEKWKNEEKLIQNKMALDIYNIKKNYKGQKRFYLIKTAHRIYGYKSWHSLKTSLGLLIQIPFFFAAYSVLSHYEGYVGISFLFIKDLAQADGLLFGVNLLPFVMTAVNLMSSFYYTKSFKLKDNRDLIIIALLFLVLLYPSPSALLIYWTMNNVFSLLKNIILRKTGIQKAPVLSVAVGEKKESLINKIIKQEPNVVILFLFILIFSLQVYWMANWPITFKYAMAIILSLAMFSTLFSFIKFRISKKIAALIITWIISIPLFYILLKYRIDNPFISNENIKLLTVTLLNIIMFYPFFSRKEITTKNITLDKGFVFQLIFTFLFFLLFYQPLVYYLSAPADIDISLKSLLPILIIVFIIPFIISVTLFFILPNKGKVLFIRVILLLLISSFIFSMILRVNTGLLDAVTFQNEQSIFKMSVVKYLSDPFIITGIWILSGYLLRNKERVIKVCCLIFILVMVVTITHKIIKSDYKALTVSKSTETELPETAYSSHEFTREGKNVVFVIADMFNGNYFGNIVDEDAKYAEIFSGFSYYPDCLAVSSFTAVSLSGIFGGYDYIPVKLNNNGKTGIEELEESARLFFKNIYNSDYAMTVASAENMYLGKDLGGKIEYPGNYVNYWKKKQGYENEGGSNKTVILFMLSIFNSSPYHFKYIIYDNSSWIILRKSALIKQLRNNSIYNLAYIDLLPEISSTKGKGNKFFYIHNNLPHNPYGIDANGNLVGDESSSHEATSFFSSTAAYYSARKFVDVMGNWINWMKENNVYDNTMIIILSDHGNRFEDNDIKLPVELGNSKNDISYAQALLLVKGFGDSGAVNIDSARVSSADIPAILTAKTDIQFSSDDKDYRKISQLRNIIYSFTVNKWDYGNKDNTKYRSYQVRGSIFDSDSWSIYNDPNE